MATTATTTLGVGPDEAQREGSRTVTSACVAAGVFVLFAHLNWALPAFRLEDRVLAASLFATFLIWLRRMLLAEHRFVPIIPLYLLQTYLQYGLPQFQHASMMTLSGRYHPSPSALTLASMLALGGELAFLVGYGAGTALKRRTGLSLSETLSGPSKAWRLPVTVFAVLSVGWGLVSTFGGVDASDFRFLTTAILNPYLGIVLVYILSQELGSRPLRWLAIGMVVLLSGVGLMTSMLEAMITPFVIFLACEWMWARRLRLGWMLAIVVFSVVMNPAKLRFRKMDWRKADPITTLSGVEQRLDKWSDSLAHTLGTEDALDRVASANTTRAGALVQLAQVIDWVPQRVSFQNGELIADSLLYLIPRFVWPDKPGISDLINNRFALAFRVSTKRGLRTTTIGVVPPADGYWDYGVPSAIGYLAITGLLLALVLAPSGERPTRKEQIVALLFCGTHLQVVLPMSMLIPWTASLVAATWITFRLFELLSSGEAAPSESPTTIPDRDAT